MSLNETISNLGGSIVNLVDKKRHGTLGLEQGDVGYDKEVYEDIRKYKHSTFDKSKFTVVGSPNITEDGIASGFSESNYITVMDVKDLKDKSWTIKTNFINNGIITPTRSNTLFKMGLWSGWGGILVVLHATQPHIMFTARTGDAGDANNERQWAVKYLDYVPEQIGASMSFDITTGTYTAKVDLGEGEQIIGTYIPTTENKQLYYINTAEASKLRLQIGCGSDNSSNHNATDLKKFSITVDGKEVFNGNKTGIDVIKEDNYTVINPGWTIYAYVYNDGSVNHTIYANLDTAPTVLYNADGTRYTGTDFTVADNVVYYGENICTYTSASNITLYMNITNDGVVSGINNVNKVTTINLPVASKNYCVTLKNYKYLSVPQSVIFGTPNSNTAKQFALVFHGNKILLYASTDGKNWDIASPASSSYSFTANILYDISFVREDGNVYKVNVFDHSTSIGSTVISVSSTEDLFNTPNKISLGSTIGSWTSYTGSIDLNAFKIYVDGNLIYQPCLKIPYTESKTGSKIVDEVYRDRVIDLYEQEGYAGYYTIQEGKKGDYTVMGSPVISEDGVASGFSLSNYLVKPTTLNLTKPFEIKFKINHKSDISLQQAFISFNAIGWYNYILDDKTRLALYAKFADDTVGNLSCAGLTIDEQTYYICFSWDGNTYILKYSTDNLNWVESKYNSSVPLKGYDNINTICMGKMLYFNYYPLTTGSIDLNTFKIYIDGELVYRAITPPNYTLPMGDVYGVLSAKSNSSEIAHYAMPSNNHTILTFGSDGSNYTAPANGWFVAGARINAGGWIELWCKATKSVSKCTSSVANTVVNTMCPVKKGDVVQLQYANYASDGEIVFVYAEGEI